MSVNLYAAIKMPIRLLFIISATILSLLLAPPPLPATVAMELGIGSRATSMGGAYTAIADDFSATYYNPAGLAQIRRAEITFTSLYASPEFSMSHQESVNLYHRVMALRGIGGGVTYLDIPPVSMDRTFGAVLGIAADMEYLFGFKKFYLGLAAYIPYEWLSKSVAVSTTGTFPHFPLYVARWASPVINVSLAYEILPTLSVGAGANLLMDMAIDTYAAVTMDFEQYGLVGGINSPVVTPVVNRELVLDAAPQAGILWKPGRGVSLGLSYRGKLVVNLKGAEEFSISVRLPFTDGTYRVLDASATPLIFANFFTPHAVTLGVAWEIGEKALGSFDLTWNKWSDFVDGRGRRPTDPFRDTFVPRAGFEYSIGENTRVSAGYFYQRSPIPDQPQESNYLDFTKHVFSMGVSYTFPMPVLRKRKLTIQGYLQYHLLEDRVIDKEETGVTVTRNGVVFPEHGPDYEISGYIFNGGITVVLEF